MYSRSFASLWMTFLYPCHSEDRSDEDELLRTLSEKSRVHPLCVIEILPPFSRLDDKAKGRADDNDVQIYKFFV